MDNINDIISSLSSEDIENLKSIADEVLGNDNDSKKLPALSDGDDLGMLLRVKDIMSKMNSKGSKNADLLMALKPHLSEKSQAKADNAARLLRLYELLPYMKDLF